MNMNCSGCNNTSRNQYQMRNARIPYAPMDNVYACEDKNYSNKMNNAYRKDNDCNNSNISDCCEVNNTVIDKCNVKRKLYEYGFVMTEVLLYLDTHPCDMEALEYYNDLKEKYNETVAMYEKHCGPLCATDVQCDKYWNWVVTPMPWEMEGC